MQGMDNSLHIKFYQKNNDFIGGFNMIEKGTKVFHKKSEQNGIIGDMWNQHSPYPTGYLVITDDGIHHICLEEDFEVCQ